MTVDLVMEQAQVFASAWALVGSRFDEGGMLDEANLAKAELAEMVANLIPNAESPFASSCCPICGVCMPHSHWPQEVVLWLQHQAARFVPDWPAKMVIRMGGDESEEIAALKSKIEYQDDMLRDASNSLRPADWYNWPDHPKPKSALAKGGRNE